MQPEDILTISKIADVIGTTAILVIALWGFFKGAVISRSLMKELLNNRDKHFDDQYQALIKEVAALRVEVKEVHEVIHGCRVTQAVYDHLKKRSS